MKNELFSGKLQVRKSPIQGYGVFAQQDFATGACIEECRVIRVIHHKNPGFVNYVFKGDEEGISLCPLGYGAIYNHSPEANAEYAYVPEHEIMRYSARKNIKAGEEIFISYGQSWFDCRQTKIIVSRRYKIKKLFPKTVIRFILITGFLSCMLGLVHSF